MSNPKHDVHKSNYSYEEIDGKLTPKISLQILAYLLISASSSAATRLDDWKANWGRDKFTDMASASIAMSFLAFMAFAISSLSSGYSLFSHYFWN